MIKLTTFGLKIFEIDLKSLKLRFNDILPFATPKGPRGRDLKMCRCMCLSSCNSHTKFSWISEQNLFWTTQPHMVPPSPTPGAWPRRPNKNPVWYILYLSFVRRHTKFGFKIFEIDFVIELKWYLTIWPLPRAQGGGSNKNVPLHAPFMWATHTPNLVGFRPMV